MALKPYGKSEVYLRNAGIYKKLDDTHYKLIQMRSLRLPGFEERGANGKGKRGSAGNTAKLNESLSRSRTRIFELALSNQWEYFVTLTLDGKKYDRYKLKEAYKAVAKMINNINSGRDTQIRYLLIPELHANKAWHFHGLMIGLTGKDLVLFQKEEKLPLYIKSKVSRGEPIYNWPDYAERFGYVVIDPVKDHEACAKYITKYITKELQNTAVELNNHIYYCSQGLKRGEIIRKGELLQNIENPDFENEYVRVKSFRTMEEGNIYFEEREQSHGTNDYDCQRGCGLHPREPQQNVSACEG